ncbi:protein FAR1-RELATED SEQUENCE 5-like isoform X2 [Aegilops tauschii subsp. strangulata]|uniref:protein FAR1-RELATED SEQUENCE 5-like isoform X2 n=1 Tax=Aegilops tauschii subsp. strangulata TaxID=200361 RepID=UPI001E1CA3B6|nr:protein FAR1-RELATED SEQUENCE 5-like isoform X2 [Aegilops tauschii subsp. strangulata]
MEFENDDIAYEFYNTYAGHVGFSVRKSWHDKSSTTNVIRTKKYVCSKAGYKDKSKEQCQRKRADTRVGCLAEMTIKISANGKYVVSSFEDAHNHELVTPSKAHLLRSQRKITEGQKAQIDILNDSGIRPKSGHEVMSRQAGGRQCLSFGQKDYKNYLRSKRMQSIQEGDTGAILQYLQDKLMENPSFFYAIQVDEDEMITNIFWADARSILDYHYFGDVVCFDTTFKTNSYGRPFAPFVGVNHHKQTVVFGATLLYDETSETFEWLFETFKRAMSGKEPNTILTDQCAAIISAIGKVFTNSIHRLCVWHMYQNAAKHLSHVFQGSKTFKKDFGKCVYDFEEVDEFLAGWNDMLVKYNLKDNEWLHRLFQNKEKWALVYGRQTFCADMKSTQRSESMNALLKRYLHVRLDLLDFFKHYERAVDDRRYAEVESDFYASQTSPKVPYVQMLIQTSKVYTPAMFEIFKGEFDMVMGYCVYESGRTGSISEFTVTHSASQNCHTVKFDPNGSKVSCSCKKFEFVGVLCRHALKVLDHNNIKELAPEYILKRWTRRAKSGPSEAIQKCSDDEDARVVLARQYGSLCRTYNNILSKAAANKEAYALLQSMSIELMEKVDQILHGNQSKDESLNHEQAEKQPVECNIENVVQAQGIKRKEPGSSNKRIKSGLELNNKNKRNTKGQGATCKNKSGDCASASSEENPSFNVPNKNKRNTKGMVLHKK